MPFQEDRIVFAAESIASYVISTIRDGDVSSLSNIFIAHYQLLLILFIP